MSRSARNHYVVAILCLVASQAFSSTIGVIPVDATRSIFLNGVDASNVRNQSLKGVDIRIDQDGHVHIEAPHYEIQEQTTYVPLDKKMREQAINAVKRSPEHKPPILPKHPEASDEALDQGQQAALKSADPSSISEPATPELHETK